MNFFYCLSVIKKNSKNWKAAYLMKHTRSLCYLLSWRQKFQYGLRCGDSKTAMVRDRLRMQSEVKQSTTLPVVVHPHCLGDYQAAKFFFPFFLWHVGKDGNRECQWCVINTLSISILNVSYTVVAFVTTWNNLLCFLKIRFTSERFFNFFICPIYFMNDCQKIQYNLFSPN